MSDINEAIDDLKEGNELSFEKVVKEMLVEEVKNKVNTFKESDNKDDEEEEDEGDSDKDKKKSKKSDDEGEDDDKDKKAS